jgi:hypothetical protein
MNGKLTTMRKKTATQAMNSDTGKSVTCKPVEKEEEEEADGEEK